MSPSTPNANFTSRKLSVVSLILFKNHQNHVFQFFSFSFQNKTQPGKLGRKILKPFSNACWTDLNYVMLHIQLIWKLLTHRLIFVSILKSLTYGLFARLEIILKYLGNDIAIFLYFLKLALFLSTGNWKMKSRIVKINQPW